MYNVLVFPAGEANSAEIHAALRSQVNIKLFGASSVERLGHHLFDRYRNSLPLISDPNFLNELNEVVNNWKIDVIIPTHDSVVAFLASNADKIEAKLLTHDLKTAMVCRDKQLTYELFSDQNFLPKRFTREADLSFPLFTKPRMGQGAVGARLIQNASEAGSIDWEDDVVCEYLPGEELTVDCFTDHYGRLQCALPRTRDRTTAGISSAGRALDETIEVRGIAESINQRLSFLGMWFFQVKKDEAGAYKLLEISARCAGSQCLTRARGINLPLLSVYAAMGRDVSVSRGTYNIRMDRLLTSRYDHNIEFEHVYIDFDDTITCANGVNTDIMRLIYQWRNDGKFIYLITRHAADIYKTLDSLAISRTLFAEIIKVSNDECKADFILYQPAIFVDNSFKERDEVLTRLGIPVFDVDTTEIFHSWKG
jgi:hypothetical protein